MEEWKEILKEDKGLLVSLDAKQKKKLKKILQSAEPSEYFGQDFAKMGELVDMLKELDLIKSDKKMTKRMKTLSEKNVDIVATAAKLRKEYEDTYRELREIVYPKSKGMRKKWMRKMKHYGTGIIPDSDTIAKMSWDDINKLVAKMEGY